MNAKNQFIANKDLAAWWGIIANDARFDAVLLHASAATLESCPSAEQREGVLFLKETLLTLSQPDAEAPKFAQPGLKHDLEVHRRNIAGETKK